MKCVERVNPAFRVLLIVLFFCSSGSQPASLPIHFEGSPSGDTGLVTVVYDGDTIKVQLDSGHVHKARLIGIDSPEIDDEREEVRFLAYAAKRFAFFHLYRKRVRIEYDWERMDKYGRLLVYVWTEDTGLFNEFILKEGFASALTKFPFREDCRKRFVAAERQARDLGKGLWSREPLLTVSAKDANDFVGELLVVKFTCVDVRIERNFVFLNSSADFSAVIPSAYTLSFPKIEEMEGEVLSVRGFLETYRGKPQILVFLPLQIYVGE